MIAYSSTSAYFPAESPTRTTPNSPTFPLSTVQLNTGSGVPFALRPGTSLGQHQSYSAPGSPSTPNLDGAGSGSGHATSRSSYLDYVKSWDDEQISNWLVEVNVGQYVQLFRMNDIRGNVLLDVDQMALKEMGIKSVGDRIKVVVAIKALRQRCITAARMERQSTFSRETTTSNGGSPSLAPSSSLSRSGSVQQPGSISTANGNVHANGNLSRRGSGRLPGRIPPPLHLSQSNTSSTPSAEAWQPLATSSTSSRYGPASSTPASSMVNSSSLNPPPRPAPPPRGIPPPSLPPPQSHPPLAPSLLIPRSSGTPPTPPNRSIAPVISTTAASPTSSSFNTAAINSSSSGSQSAPWSGEYGLPRAPSPGNLAGGVFGGRNTSLNHARSISSSTPTRGTLSYQGSHRKTPSLNPVVVTAAPYAHSQPLSAHPYATPTSPPVDTPSTIIHPSTSRVLLPSPAINTTNPLSPVFEVAGVRTPTSADARGEFSTTPPISAGGIPTSTSASSIESIARLEAVLRKAVKFIGEDGVSKVIAVADCLDGREVLSKVLSKFHKADETDSWGFFRSTDEHARAINESDLMTICRDGQAPERQRGIILRRLHHHHPSSSSGSTQRKRDRKLQWMFGEDHTPDTNLPGGVTARNPPSPNYLGVEIPSTTIEPASPLSDSEFDAGDYDRRRSSSNQNRLQELPAAGHADRLKTNRASIVSVMEGLGGTEWSSPGSPNSRHLSNPTARSPASGSGLKLRNFFGQRPPSELIATHLTEYFPRAEKNQLSKQVRESMRKSIVRRDSSYNLIASKGTSWEKAPDRLSLTPQAFSRFSGSSMGSNQLSSPSKSTAPTFSPVSPPGRSGSSIKSQSDSVHSSTSHLEPPDESAEDNDDDDSLSYDARSTSNSSTKADRRMSRISGVSRTSVFGWDRKSRNSDAASILTVDEVTAELETRRASMAENLSEEEEELEAKESDVRPPSIAISSGTDDEYDDAEESDEEEEAEEEEEQGEQEMAEEVRARSSDKLPNENDAHRAGKTGTKWIKGALIGAGSFGSVYLGMNPMNGLLMAVKQVELPTGHSHNEERKMSMLDALEREIELLKVLRHENIVQYLDSSSDETHLNIFLEYVPGGSVSALLSNYGAFEEALVSKFVRQILTGLEYLHEREIIHRDIKGANILVDNKGGIKISDFGISKKVEDNLLAGNHRPSLQGSVYWMAPEVVKQTAYTSKADIWSLGCLVVEMLTGAHPWANLTQMQAIFRIGSSIRPAIPDDISVEADDFLDSTFLIDHHKRPSAFTLLRHPFVHDRDISRPTSQQTPTRATFRDSTQ